MSTQKNEQYHILSPEWLTRNKVPDDAQYRPFEFPDGSWLPSRYTGCVLTPEEVIDSQYRTQRTDLPPEAYVTPPTNTTGSGREGETPETDRQVSITNQGVGHVSIVSADFARQLERQRDAAMARISELEQKLKQYE